MFHLNVIIYIYIYIYIWKVTNDSLLLIVQLLDSMLCIIIVHRTWKKSCFFFNFVQLVTVWQRNKLYHRSILIILTMWIMIIIDNCCNNNKAVSHTSKCLRFLNSTYMCNFEFSMLRWSRLHVETALIVMHCSFTILFLYTFNFYNFNNKLSE